MKRIKYFIIFIVMLMMVLPLLGVSAETICYTERVTDAPSFHIYTAYGDANNPIVWTHNVPPGLLDSVTHVGLYIEAYDVDYPLKTENDRVYFNGYDLGLLEGLNDTWITVEKTVPVSAIREGINNMRVQVDEAVLGWKVTIRSSELRFYCSSTEPDFTIGVTPLNATVTQGETAEYTVNLVGLNNFGSPVTLNVSGLPTGANAVFNPNPATPSPTDQSSLSITTTGSTPTGTYTLTITGQSGEKEHSSEVTLQINAATAPDFSIDAAPATREITQGETTTYTVDLTAINGFNTAVDLSVSGLPEGANGVFGTNPTTPTGQSILTITTTGSTAAGTYPLTIKGTGGGETHETQVTLTINAQTLEKDFTIDASPHSQTVTQGDSTTYTIELLPINGFSGDVHLSAHRLPPDAQVTFSQRPVTLTASAQSVVTITTNKNTPVGDYVITLSGVCNSIRHNTEVRLTVEEATDRDFTLNATPQSREIIQGQSASYTLGFSVINEFNAPVTLSLEGLPANAAGAFSVNPVNPADTQQSVLEITTTEQIAVGTYTVTVNAKGGEKEHSTQVTLTVQEIPEEPDFTISAQPQNQTLLRGGQSTHTISVTGLNGFTEAVTLELGSLPAGASARLVNDTVTPDGKTELVLTAGTEMAAGSYSITVTGNGGGKQHAVTVVFIIGCPAVTVDIDAEPSSGSAPFEVQLESVFTAPDYYAESDYTFQWDLGDGNTASGRDVTHTFQTPGNYTVVLTVTNPCGGTATAQKIIAADSFEGSIKKSFSKSDATPGDTVIMTIEIANQGTVDFNNIKVRDELDPAFQYIEDDSGITPVQTGGELSWNFPKLHAGGTIVFNVKLKITADAQPGTVSNTAYLSHESIGAEIPSAPALLIIRKIEATLRKQVDKAQAKPGDTLQYTLVLKNASSVALSGIKLEDELDANLDFVSQSVKGSLDFKQRGRRLLWTGQLEAGQQAVINIRATVSYSTFSGSRITNTAEMEADLLEGKITSDTVETQVSSEPVSSTQVRLTHRSEVPQAEVGRIIRFNVTVANYSNGNLVSPVIDVYMPQGFSFVAGSALLNNQRFADPPGRRHLIWTLPSMQGGATMVLRYQAVIGADVSRGRNISRVTLQAVDGSGQNINLEADAFINVASSSFVFYSGVEGTVFLDRDYDEFFSMADTPLEGIEVRMSTGDRAITDTLGRYSFQNLFPGEYAVAVNRATLPEKYRTASMVPKVVTLSDGLTDVADFAIKFQAKKDDEARLEGRVFYDKTRNGSYETNDILAENFTAKLDNQSVATGKNGKFIFTHLKTGKHTIEIRYGPKRVNVEVDLKEGRNHIDIPLKFTGIKIIVHGEGK